MPDRNGGTFKLPGRPWKFSGGELSIPGAPSIQGENNHEVLKGLGYDDGAIKKMEDSGVVVGNFAAMMIASVMGQVGAAAAPAADEEQHDD